MFSYNEASIKNRISKIRNVTFIHGYSSMIYEVAKVYNTLNLEKPKGIKMIKGTSEKVFPAYQNEVKKAFDLQIISEYTYTKMVKNHCSIYLLKPLKPEHPQALQFPAE